MSKSKKKTPTIVLVICIVFSKLMCEGLFVNIDGIVDH